VFISEDIFAKLATLHRPRIFLVWEVPEQMKMRGETSVLWTIGSLSQGKTDDFMTTFCLRSAVLALAEISQKTGARMSVQAHTSFWANGDTIHELAEELPVLTESDIDDLNGSLEPENQIDKQTYKGAQLKSAMQLAASHHGRLQLMKGISQKASRTTP